MYLQALQLVVSPRAPLDQGSHHPCCLASGPFCLGEPGGGSRSQSEYELWVMDYKLWDMDYGSVLALSFGVRLGLVLFVGSGIDFGLGLGLELELGFGAVY